MKKIISFILLAFALWFTLGNSSTIAASEGNKRLEEDRIKATITAYFNLRYEGQKLRSFTDFSQIAATSDQETTANWLQLEHDRQEIELFIADTFGVYVLDYKFSLDYLSIEINGTVAKVRLYEGNEVTYATSPDSPSMMAYLEHTITLVKAKDGWRISNDQYRDENVRLLETLSVEEVLENIRANYEAQFAPPPTIEQGEAMPSYNRTAAVNWADAYWNTIQPPVPTYIRNQPGWNSSWPTQYKSYSPTNCTNFVSQAVFAGTNWTNSDPNYFYPDSSHYNDGWYYKFSSPVDGSSPWINVGGFTSFITNNPGRGPHATSGGSNVCGLAKGDPVTMKQGGELGTCSYCG